MTAGKGQPEPSFSPAVSLRSQSIPSGPPIAPFLIGTAVGGVVGAVAGTLLSSVIRRLLFWLIHIAERRLSDADRDRLRLDLMLQ